jgi:pimeloyl-ACP methyl ester carboxylesterase
MWTRRIAAQGATASVGSILLLPGAHQQPGDFVRSGFDAAMHERRLAFDLILAAPQLAHLTDRDWLPQLHQQVVQPARAAGHFLWLGGISLGAFMALRFAAQYPGCIDGLCLIAPYLGSRIVAAEIARCQTLQAWQPQVPDEQDDERHIWRYVRDLGIANDQGGTGPRIFLGFGEADRFADTQRLLARALPAASTSRVDGGHEWPVWQRLWGIFLDRYFAS